MLTVIMEQPSETDQWWRWSWHHREHHDQIREKIRGMVGSLTLTNPGSGYTQGTYALGFSGSGGATGTYTVDSTGVVTAVTLTGRGEGYNSVPTLTFPSGGGSSAAASALLWPNLTQYTLDPIPSDTTTWLMWNQQTHNDMNGVLGLQGSDLQGTDFRNQQQMREWIWNHYLEHYAAAQALAI